MPTPILTSPLPDLLTHTDGTPVTKESWSARREELVAILAENIYGEMPPPCPVQWVVSESEMTCAGFVRHDTVKLILHTPRGLFTFPIQVFVPTEAENPPCFLLLNFRDALPDRYFPIEEICNSGFAAAMVCYEDVTRDNGDFSDGIAPFLLDLPRTEATAGKITLWAYAASRVMDYLITRTDIDTAKVSLIGHSRLGKTALWAGANDDRFFCAINNMGGCAGAAVERFRNEGAETASRIARVFPFWFCEKYAYWANHVDEMPFDQHFLAAANIRADTPRRIYNCDAVLDRWANPAAEYLSVCEAARVFALLGEAQPFGGVEDTRIGVPELFIAENAEPFHVFGSRLGYHLRRGNHFLSRRDWVMYMTFLSGEKG
ncbi:MAG: hypothetical protein LBR73_04040 [Oscillospiraceae bacterium]|jgi:hypothetical protein|nr:hypothetical protein [Oscillospiraceae bacterium]